MTEIRGEIDKSMSMVGVFLTQLSQCRNKTFQIPCIFQEVDRDDD